MDENKEKKSLKAHPVLVFWIRFVLWATSACFLPFAFIVWRFQLFQTISSIQIGGWGLIALLIVAVFVFTIIKYVKMAFANKYSFAIQCINGLIKVILPLSIVMLILYAVRNNVDMMLQVLGCVILCEIIAIPLNPLPKWAWESQKNTRVEERKETADYIIDSFFKKKKENENK